MSEFSNITLVLGGARSGKSRFAERLAAASGKALCYLATAEARDAEMQERIQLHQIMRGSGWSTIEAPLELAAQLQQASREDTLILVDCLTLWLSNLMEHGRDIDAAFDELLAAFDNLNGPVILVSNEVGQGIVPDNALARAFRDHAGRLHQRIAARADDAYFIIAGLGQKIK